MIGDSPFNGPRLLLADARDDIHRLNTTVANFLKYTPHPVGSHPDPEKHCFVHVMKFRDPLPENLPILIRKVVGSLRSALDQAVYASVVLLKSGSPRFAKFPFSDTREGLSLQINKKCKAIAPEIVRIIEELKPYRGGNDMLWSLNRVRNIKEHRLLVPAMLAGGVMIENFFPSARGYMSREQGSGNHWNAETNELTFETLFPLDTHKDIKTILFIRFGEIEVVGGRDVVPLLSDFATVAETCVDQIETETRRLVRERSS
jgi:hypothetical protein